MAYIKLIKKVRIYPILICAGISLCAGTSLCACSDVSNAAAKDPSEKKPVIVVEKSEDSSLEAAIVDEQNAPDDKNASDMSTEADDKTGSESSVPVPFDADKLSGVIADGTKHGVIYTCKDMHTEKSDENGIVYFTSDYQSPSLEIKGNTPASAAINDYLGKGVDSFISDLDIMAAEAEVYFNTMYTPYDDPADVVCDPFLQDSAFMPARLDENVVSLREKADAYSGGTGVSTVVSGYNFDARSGSLITLSTISNDTQQLKDSAKDYIIKCCDTLYNDSDLYDNYKDYLDSVFDDGNWYLTKDGVVFIAGQSLIAPLPSGIFEFEVPYECLESFNETYLPSNQN